MSNKNEKIEAFLSNLDTEVDILNCVDIDNIETFNAYYDIQEMIQENGGFDIEIIYYSTAMEYLTEHDTSLSDSMEIASDMGYETANLNSELLASLLASNKAVSEFEELQAEIDEFFEELEEDEDEEEE